MPVSGRAYWYASLCTPPCTPLLPPARTRDCTLLAEPLLGLQLNPLCKFMTNELLFAVFTSPTQKDTKYARYATRYPSQSAASLSLAPYLILFPLLLLSFSMAKWVFLCAVACCVYAKSIACQGDGICYLMFDFKVPVLPPPPVHAWQSREWKSATVAKEAIKHKACR